MLIHPCIAKAEREARVTRAMDPGIFDSYCPQESPASSALWHRTNDTNSFTQTEGSMEARLVPPREQDGREGTER